MAQGDIIVFDQFIINRDNGLYDLDSDDFQIALIDNTTALTNNTADPHWNGTGTTNLFSNQVSIAGSYAGPVALAGEALTEPVDGTFQWDADDPAQWAQNASSPNDIYYAVVFNNTDTNKRCAFAIDLAGPVNLQAGPLTVQFNANGIFRTVRS